MSKNQSLTLRSQSAELVSFDQDKLAIIKKTYGRGLDDAEFGLYIAVAKSKGLDPVLGQIHAVKRNDGGGGKQMTIQVGIDGYRLISARTGQHAGTDPIQYRYKGNNNNPEEAVCTVYRIVGGRRVPYTASAKWSEYYPGEKQGFMWRKMPETMLGKCAEAKALRMAFPGDLGGMYVEEEMQQMKDVTPLKEIQDVNQRFSDEPEKEVAKIQLSGFCVVCGEELLKSSNRPFYYCLNWQDKEAKHTVVKEDDWTNFCAEQCVKTDEPEFQSNIEFDSSGN